MKHRNKLLAGLGILGVLAWLTARGASVSSPLRAPAAPTKTPSIIARDPEGKVLLTRELKDNEDPMPILETLQRELPARFPGGGDLRIQNGEKWWGIMAPGIAYAWGQAKKPAG